ncbi:hypothetical protein ACLKHO_001463 [Campylobacter jejuni]|nr:hypothetical protein [Campylobacter jejuni]HED9990874.1 hypothetical protein [Campylobacter jejuni]
MFISSKTELIQTIKNLTINNKEVKQIDFIYPNFSILHAILKNIDFHQRKMLSKNQILAMEILEILKQTCDNHNNIEVNIHTLNELDAGQNVNLKDLSSSEICTKVYLEDLEEEIQDKKQDKDLNLFYHTDKNNLCIEFINTLKELAKDSEDITTLDELIENIDPDNINSEKFDDFKKKVLEKIGNVIESDFFKNSISPTLKNTYEKFINELLEHIKKLAEEKEYEKIKIILSAIAGVAIATVVAVLTGGAGLAILAAGLFSLMGSASEYYEFAQRDYGTLLTPLAAFLATRCAMFIHYINSRLLSCVLIIDKKEIIDLSGFGLYLGSDESNIASNLAYKITLSEEIKSIENIFSEIFLNSEQKDKGYKNTSNDSKSSNLPAFISTQKLSNLYLKNNAILKNLQEDIKQFIYFSYIESPNFNSSKLAEFFAQKNQNAQIDLNTTKMSKNYLIISNIPNKYNAGLSESLTQEIANYNIQDKYRRIKKNIDTSKKTYDSTRDYSEYSIEMPQDENETIQERDDYTFFNQSLNSIELIKSEIYILKNTALEKYYKEVNDEINLTAIQAYNEALQILQDFANGLYNTSKDKTGRYIEDKNKTRRLLEKLNIIGQNNLKAMYMGINGNEESLKAIGKRENNTSKASANADITSETKTPPNFIGRLATTIIIEDGLYMG